VIIGRVRFEGLEHVIEVLERYAQLRTVVALKYIPHTHSGNHFDTIIIGIPCKECKRAEEMLPGFEPLCAGFMFTAVSGEVLVVERNDTLVDTMEQTQ